MREGVIYYSRRMVFCMQLCVGAIRVKCPVDKAVDGVMRQFMGDERRRGKIVRSFDAVL